MAQFIVRVEIHSASSEDYESLHEKMKAKGYSREIQDGQGTWFHLPTAEYTATKSSNAFDVREEVRGIASSVKSGHFVLVTEVANISWWLSKK
ncbi:type V toxin-antitoxin system endoribonuclease antitoxin GhoS [Rahnella sp. NRRL B-41462]|uniref:type V toxin-antitoxin system endoribonuclease antitoxin GhoS n=1 Tax=Rahnella sp. NRRL B-41462 TaxID=1610579 RepID=UPI000DD4D06E|nr:type V toxin-antitoxin system endoribonuclease antitoxin GhoS [Rahnella sp. NRRL B-41462]